MKVGKPIRVLLSFILAFAMIMPSTAKVEAASSHPVDSNAIIVQADITGISTNNHTVARAIWTYQDYVYIMIDSTHPVESVVIGSLSSTDRDIHAPGEQVTVGSTVYKPDQSKGNTKDAHLTIVRFSLATFLSTVGLNESGQYPISVYSEVGQGHDIVGGTLTITVPKAKAVVTKSWDGGPKDPVKMQLYREYLNGSGDSAVGSQFTLSPANPTETITGLRFTDNLGRIYRYYVEEVDLGAGYTATYAEVTRDFEGGVYVFTIGVKNTYKPPMTDIKITKIWKDETPEDRPASITYKLYADGGAEPVRTGSTDSSNSWMLTFKDLPETDNNGKTIVYTVKEDPVPGYVTSIDGFTVTNVRTEKTSIDVTKLWKDKGGPSRPSSVTFNLLANGNEVDEIQLNEAGGWKGKFTDLDKYDGNGKLIKYTITEDAVTGYTPSVDGFTITNTRAEKMSIPVEKHWKDDGPDGRPAKVVINLMTGDTKVKSLDLTAAMEWKGSFKDVDKFDSEGDLIKYTIKEEAVEGYKSVVDGFKVTNTRVGSRDIKVEKSWLDDGVTSGRPTFITIDLYAGDFKADTADLTAEMNWQHTFKDKPMYTVDGKAISYSIKEKAVEGYETTIDGFKVKNLRVGKTEVSVEKKWLDDGSRDINEITIVLMKEVVSMPPVEVSTQAIALEEVDTLKLNVGNGWKGAFKNLPKYDENGREISYFIKELEVPGYTSSVKDNGDGSFTVTNRRTDITSVSGVKHWMDEEGTSLRPETITVILLQNGKEIDRIDIGEEDEWSFSFDELDKYDEKGIAYVYTIDEVEVEGYKTTVKGFDLHNLRIGEIEIPVEKIWKDNGTRDIEEVTVHLYRKMHRMDRAQSEMTLEEMIHHTHVRMAVLSEENDWSFTFENLPEFDMHGMPIEYYLEEVSEEGYDSEVVYNEDGSITVTNTRVGTLDIDGEKSWFDEGEASRPESITVILNRNDVELERVVVTSVDEWSYSFKDLPEFDENGIAYIYEIEELPVAGYNTFYVGYNIQNVRFGMTNVNGKKTWNDLFGRPESIVINLLKNGVEIDEVTLSPEGDEEWTYSFTGLPAFDEEGIAYIYTVTEDLVTGYEAVVNGYDILNRQLRATLRIIKVDDFDFPVEDVVFEVKDEEGNLVFRGTTDEDGILETVLPLGTYIVREISAPADYIMDPAPKIVILNEDGKVVELKVVNILEIEEVEPKPLPPTPKPQPKPQLPSTGTANSTIFYGLGILMALGGVLLLRKRRTT